MKFTIPSLSLMLLTGAMGCAHEAPVVERVPVAAPVDRSQQIDYPRQKPMPEQSRLYDRDLPPEPPFYDPPLVSQKTPEQTHFEAAYRGVGRPRITVFVNRNLESDPNTDLRPGQYDEGDARALDYLAVENILTDFLACQGTVEIISPTTVRQKLTDEQLKDLQSNKPRVQREIAAQLETDVLILVTAHPTRQTPEGLQFRLVGEALNIKGGQQLARAVVDVPPPLEKSTLNRYTRFMARKIMMDLTQAWSAPDPNRPAAPEKTPDKK